jgi:hypothetical protein
MEEDTRCVPLLRLRLMMPLVRIWLSTSSSPFKFIIVQEGPQASLHRPRTGLGINQEIQGAGVHSRLHHP